MTVGAISQERDISLYSVQCTVYSVCLMSVQCSTVQYNVCIVQYSVCILDCVIVWTVCVLYRVVYCTECCTVLSGVLSPSEICSVFYNTTQHSKIQHSPAQHSAAQCSVYCSGWGCQLDLALLNNSHSGSTALQLYFFVLHCCCTAVQCSAGACWIPGR